jgi:hypothetical protein
MTTEQKAFYDQGYNARKRKDTAPSNLSPEQLLRCDLVIRQTFEKVSALFLKVHNLQIEVQELRSEQAALARLVLSALAVTDASTATAVDYETLKQVSHRYKK